LTEISEDGSVDDNQVYDQSISDPTSPLIEIEGEEEMGVTRSTNEPLKKRPSTSRKRQAEEEYKLIQNLSQSIAEKHKRKTSDKQASNNILDAFGNYVTKALSELDSRTCHLAQNKINNIIFQAQAGLLVHEIQPEMTMNQPQSFFRPIPPTTSSSPQSSIYPQQNSPFRNEPAIYNSTCGWPAQN
jgi:hypothetical protein